MFVDLIIKQFPYEMFGRCGVIGQTEITVHPVIHELVAKLNYESSGGFFT